MECGERVLFLTKYTLCSSLLYKASHARAKESHKETDKLCLLVNSAAFAALQQQVMSRDPWCNMQVFTRAVICAPLSTGQTGRFVCVPEKRLRQSVRDATSSRGQGERYVDRPERVESHGLISLMQT